MAVMISSRESSEGDFENFTDLSSEGEENMRVITVSHSGHSGSRQRSAATWTMPSLPGAPESEIQPRIRRIASACLLADSPEGEMKSDMGTGVN